MYLFCVIFCVWHWLVCSPYGSHIPRHTLNLFQSPQVRAESAVQVMPYIMNLTAKLYQAQMLQLCRAGSTVPEKLHGAALRMRGLAAPTEEKEA